MGYLIGVPIDVPLYCSISTSFWNILMSYFIYSVVKAMEPGWSFVKKLDRGRASFLRYWHLKFTPEKPNSYITISVSKLQVPCCSPYRGRTFPHSYPLLHSLVFTKTHFMWNEQHFLQPRKLSLTQTQQQILKVHQKWTWDQWNSFRNFVYVSSYLHSTSFAWKRDYIISQNLQTSQTSPRPF